MTGPRGESAVIVGERQCRDDGSYTCVSAPVTIGDRTHDVWFKAPSGPLEVTDAYLPAVLLPAMRVGLPLRMDGGTVSPRLLDGAERAQLILSCWYDHLHRVPVQAHPRSLPRQDGERGVAAFFTGGVDSFHTVLTHRDEIDTLVFIRLLQPDQDPYPRLTAQIEENLHKAAGELGKRLLVVETNLLRFSKPYNDWTHEYHGAALASVALLLSPRFRRIYIAGAVNYMELSCFGSHPILDPLWSSDETELIYDGPHLTRSAKVAQIATNETVLRYLQVCWEHRGGAYNCGQCLKCLRTAIALHLAGALERCATLHGPLDLERIAQLEMPGPSVARSFRVMLDEIAHRGDEPALEAAVRRALERSPITEGEFRLQERARAAEAKVERLTKELTQTRAQAERAEAQLREANARADRLAVQLDRLRSSRSWRWTEPLRAAGRWLRRSLRSRRD